jgi:hypothetical protein
MAGEEGGTHAGVDAVGRHDEVGAVLAVAGDDGAVVGGDGLDGDVQPQFARLQPGGEEIDDGTAERHDHGVAVAVGDRVGAGAVGSGVVWVAGSAVVLGRCQFADAFAVAGGVECSRWVRAGAEARAVWFQSWGPLVDVTGWWGGGGWVSVGLWCCGVGGGAVAGLGLLSWSD